MMRGSSGKSSPKARRQAGGRGAAVASRRTLNSIRRKTASRRGGGRTLPHRLRSRRAAWRRKRDLRRRTRMPAGSAVAALLESAASRAALLPISLPVEEAASSGIEDRSPAPSESTEALESIRAEAYAHGHREGLFEGGEAKLGRLIPHHTMLPEITVDAVIAEGFRSVADSLYPLLPAPAVFQAAVTALQEGRPLSIVRLGDGELLTLAHGTVIPTEDAIRWGSFLPYAGVQLPDAGAREALAQAVRSADIIGVPQSRHPSYQGLLFPVLRHYGMDYRTMQLTTSTVNYELNAGGYLARLLEGRRVLLIGNQSPELADLLSRQGIAITGWVAPVQGVADVEAVLIRTREQPDFDLALVAAGIAAVMICSRLAAEQGKLALDLGHLADKLIRGEMFLTRL